MIPVTAGTTQTIGDSLNSPSKSVLIQIKNATFEITLCMKPYPSEDLSIPKVKCLLNGALIKKPNG